MSFDLRPQNKIRGAKNPSLRYGAQDVRTWRELHAQGLSYDGISALTGVAKTTIADALRGDTWGWLD